MIFQSTNTTEKKKKKKCLGRDFAIFFSAFHFWINHNIAGGGGEGPMGVRSCCHLWRLPTATQRSSKIVLTLAGGGGEGSMGVRASCYLWRLPTATQKQRDSTYTRWWRWRRSHGCKGQLPPLEAANSYREAPRLYLLSLVEVEKVPWV
jgi:hypothetical protein